MNNSVTEILKFIYLTDLTDSLANSLKQVSTNKMESENNLQRSQFDQDESEQEEIDELGKETHDMIVEEHSDHDEEDTAIFLNPKSSKDRAKLKRYKGGGE